MGRSTTTNKVAARYAHLRRDPRPHIPVLAPLVRVEVEEVVLDLVGLELPVVVCKLTPDEIER
jgi:hypothetical protein